MNFQTYSRGIFDMLENYMSLHCTQSKETIKSWAEWGWLDDVYRPIYEAYQDLANASNEAEFLLALEWASHLNHASGTLIRDYCYLEHGETVLNKLEQNGLDATFPHWQDEIGKSFGCFRVSDKIKHPDTLQALISPQCIYCGSSDLPTDKWGEVVDLTCETCAILLEIHGQCLACEHGIGLYGELCLDCMLEHSEVLV